MNVFLVIALIAIVLLIGFYFYVKTHPDFADEMMTKQLRKNRSLTRKKDLLGKKITIEREGRDRAKVLVYEPAYEGENRPLIFVLHGGSFFDGSADLLDSFCDRMKDQWESVIVSVDYAKVDEHPLPYAQEELLDIILYFGKHSYDYHVDVHRFAGIGFTAGAYILAGGSAEAKEKGLSLKGLILCDPLLDASIVKLAEFKILVEPVIFVLSGKNPSLDKYREFESKMKEKGTDIEEKVYEAAYPNFIDMSQPEYASLEFQGKEILQSEEQKDLARAFEIHAGGMFRRFFDTSH